MIPTTHNIYNLQCEPLCIAGNCCEELSKHVLYHGSVPGSAKKLRLQFGCLSPATAQAQVAGTKLPSNGDSIDAWVDPDDAGETDLTIGCIWKDKRHSVEISIEETVDLAKVKIELHVIGGHSTPTNLAGSDEVTVEATEGEVQLHTNATSSMFEVETQSSPSKRARQKDGQNKLALHAGVPTPRIKVSAGSAREVYLLLHSAQEERRIRVKLIGEPQAHVSAAEAPSAPSPKPFRGVDTVHHDVSTGEWPSADEVLMEEVGLATSAFVLTLCGASAVLTVAGESLDPPPVLRWLLLPLQLLALSDLHDFGSTSMTSGLTAFARGLKMSCLHEWPSKLPRAKRPHEGTLWRGDRRLVDVPTVQAQHAIDTLKVAGMLLAAAISMHVLWLAFRVTLPVDCHCQWNTLPHRWRLGAWEMHLVMMLAYPMSWACSLVGGWGAIDVMVTMISADNNRWSLALYGALTLVGFLGLRCLARRYRGYAMLDEF
eukprot:g2995.t1